MGTVFKALNKAMSPDNQVEELVKRNVFVDKSIPDTSKRNVNREIHKRPLSKQGQSQKTVKKELRNDNSVTVPRKAKVQTARTAATAKPKSTVYADKSTNKAIPKKNTRVFKRSADAEPSIDTWDERLLEVLSSYPQINEGVRRLRNKITHPKDEQKIKSILVTSASPSEGKSFLTANLGISIAQDIGKHALLVDCDMRKPVLADIFGVNNNKGLINYLSEGMDLNRLLRKTGQSKLSILPSGPPPVNPAEVLTSGKMISLIHELTERYNDRYIIMDSPPSQAAAETAVLAENVDAVVIVVRWGRSSRDVTAELVETIGREKIIGIVFNAYRVNSLEEKLVKSYGYGDYFKNAGGY